MRRSSVLAVLSSVVLFPAWAVAQVEGTPCPAEPTDHPIVYGEVVTCAISPAGDTDIFRFLAVGNEKIVIVGHSPGFAIVPCLELITPGGGRKSACSFAGTNRIDVTLNEPGLHSILVGGGGFAGDYRLTLERIIPPSPLATPIQFGQTLAGRIDPAGDLDVFSFEAVAGAQINLQATSPGFAIPPCIELFAPDSTRTVACNFSASNAMTLTLGQPGTYSILMSGGGYIGNFNLALQCLSGGCVAQQATLTIPATSPWVDSGIDLIAGQEVATRATAGWTPDPLLAQTGPLGHPGPCDPMSAGCPIHANHGALVARIGTEPPFLVGEAFAFFAPSSGRLKFMINDDVNLLSDNLGAATIYVLYSAPPLGVDTPGHTGSAELLGPAAPNPFVGSTELRFRLAERSSVGLRVYDMAGRLVRALLSSTPLEAGEHLVRWDGRSDDGSRSAPGVYFYRLELPGRQHARRAILLK